MELPPCALLQTDGLNTPRAGAGRGRLPHPRAPPAAGEGTLVPPPAPWWPGKAPALVVAGGLRATRAPAVPRPCWPASSTPHARRRRPERPPRLLLPGDRGGPPRADGPLPCGRRPPRRRPGRPPRRRDLARRRSPGKASPPQRPGATASRVPPSPWPGRAAVAWPLELRERGEKGDGKREEIREMGEGK